jgi:hypothetical protein
MRPAVLLSLLVGCAPAVALDDGAATTSDDTAVDTTASTSTATSATTSASTTTSVTASSTTTDASTSSTDDGNDDAYEEDSGGTGCAFTCPPPPGTGGGGGGVVFECDLVAQDCPEGEKCMPWANDGGVMWNASRCSPLDPDPDAPNDPCTVEGSGVSGIDSCGLGAMCFEVDPKTNIGVCRSFCLPGVEPCAAEDACVTYVPGIVEVCVPACDPLAPDCPQPGSCVPEHQGFVCVPGIGADPGASCTGAHDCASGSMCVSGDLLPSCASLGCCSEACDLAGPDNCPGTTTCTPWDADAPPPWDDVGVCVLP